MSTQIWLTPPPLPLPQETILEKPVTEWPAVQVLITFHSTGFPLEKSQEYVTLRNPFCINSPHMQSTLLDRRYTHTHIYIYIERERYIYFVAHAIHAA